MGDRGGMVEDGGRRKRAKCSVMQAHVSQGHQERKPRLIEADNDHHHEEVEVHLDEAVGEMDEHCR